MSLPKISKHPGRQEKSPKRAPGEARGTGKRAVRKPGPGRPSAARTEEINREILSQARKEFKRSGYERARMDVIATAAGVSKGTLYDRYPTKEALLRAVITERVATWSQDWQPEGPAPADLRERLKQRARRLIEYYCSDKLESLERLFTGGPSMNELRRMRHEVGHQRTIQIIAQDIIDATTDQPMQPLSAMQLAELLMGMLYGWWRMHREVRQVSREEGLAFADHAIDILFEGRSAWTRR
jgi:TetR/AcrR family transcriptional repressor of mexJK operon